MPFSLCTSLQKRHSRSQSLRSVRSAVGSLGSGISHYRTTSGNACPIRQAAIAPALFSSLELWAWQFWQQPRNHLNSYRSSHGVISTKSCSGPSKSPAISGKPGALNGTNLRSCLSCFPAFCSRVLDLYLAWIKVLHLRYIELYSYFITFVCFLLCENVNCVLIVSPLNLQLYYVLLRRKFPETFGAQVFKHRHQEVISKVDETVSLFMASCSFVENAEARKESLTFSDNHLTLWILTRLTKQQNLVA